MLLVLLWPSVPRDPSWRAVLKKKPLHGCSKWKCLLVWAGDYKQTPGRLGNYFCAPINTNMCPTGCNLRQRSIVRDLLSLWLTFVRMDSLCSALSTGGGGLKGRLTRLKHAIFQGVILAAQVRLRRKVVDEGWSRGVSYHWLEITASLKKRWCNGIARYALLRWRWWCLIVTLRRSAPTEMLPL